MHSTQIRTARDLRNNFADIQRLLEDHDQVVITNNGKGAAVVIHFDDYAVYEEYLREKYLIRIADMIHSSRQQEIDRFFADAEAPPV